MPKLTHEVAAGSTICLLAAFWGRDFVSLFHDLFRFAVFYFSLSSNFLFLLVSGAYKHCHESFLFSFVNASGVASTKMKLRGSSNQSGIYCASSYGPTFGGGHDLHICSNSNGNNSSYSNLNYTYECPPNVTANTFLAGINNFYVNELEVFVCQSDLA